MDSVLVSLRQSFAGECRSVEVLADDGRRASFAGERGPSENLHRSPSRDRFQEPQQGDQPILGGPTGQARGLKAHGKSLGQRGGKGAHLDRRHDQGFLNSSTIVLNIREGALLSVWEQTDSNDDEAERFAEALELLEQQATDRTAKPSRILGDRIMARFADSEWHALDAIAAGLGVGQAEAKATLEQMRLRGAYRSKCEHKQVGLRWHYRIFRQDKLVSTAELIEKLGPIVDELLRQGKTNAATVSIGTVGSCGAQIKRLLDEWSK